MMTRQNKSSRTKQDPILPTSNSIEASSSRAQNTANIMVNQPQDSTMPSQRNSSDAWYKVQLFRGMINDVRRRIPYYASDWSDAWDYRIIPATVYMYFAK